MALIVKMLGANALSPEFRRAAKDMGGLNKKVALAGKAFLAFGAVAAAAIVGVGLKLSIDLDKGLREVGTLMGGLSKGEMKDMSDELKEISIQSGAALDKLVKAKYDIISAGFTDAAASANLLTASANLAVAGVSDVSVAADLLTTTMNAYGFSTEQVADVSDKLFTTVKLGKTTLDQMGGSLGRVLGVAGTLGIGFEELLASFATLTTTMGSSERATTSLLGAINAMAKPTDTLKGIITDLGFESATALLKSEGFAGAIKLIADTAKKTNVPLTDVFGSIEALQGILPLTGTASEVLAANIESLGDTFGATDEASVEMEKSAALQLARMKSAFAVLAIELVNKFVPSIADAAAAIANFIAVPISESLAAEHREMSILFGILKDTNVSQDVRNKAISDLNSLYPNYIGNLDLEKAGIEDIEIAQKKANTTFLEKIKLAAAEEVLTAQTKKVVDAQLAAFEATKKWKAILIETEGQHVTTTRILRGESVIVDETAIKIRFLAAEMIKAREAAGQEEQSLTDLAASFSSLGIELDSLSTKSDDDLPGIEEDIIPAMSDWGKTIEITQEQWARMVEFMLAGNEQVKMSIGSIAQKWLEENQNIINSVQTSSAAISKIGSQLTKGRIDNIKFTSRTQIEAINARAAADIENVEKTITDQELLAATISSIEAKRATDVAAIRSKAQADEAKARKAMKPFLIASAIVNTALGVTKAFAQTGIGGFIAGALIAAAGAIEVATISAQQFQHGGMVSRFEHGGSTVRGTDTIPTALSPGEIVSTAGAASLFGADILRMNQEATGQGIGGQGGDINITIHAVDAASVRRLLIDNPIALSDALRSATDSRTLTARDLPSG
ncbi:hypothetical protein LCGC14_1265990 [marine sediment metagenome]|uniref:Phage tail tape measure protein domain-containing protein n=1 Tax=marine sediment metagenome TaxID=412755 RepID=A0A0F9L1I3_9ZZZZ